MTSHKMKLAAMVAVPTVIALGAGIYYYYYKNKTSVISNEDKQDNLDENVGIDDPDPQKRAFAYKELGNKNFRAGRYDRSVTCYSSAIDLIDKANIEELCIYYQNRATAYGKLNKLQESLEDVSNALKLKPRYLKALNRRSRVLEDLHRYKESLQDVTALCLLEHFSVDDNTMRAENLMKIVANEMAEKELPQRVKQLTSVTMIKNHFMNFVRNPLFMVEKEEQQNGDGGKKGEKFGIKMSVEFDQVLSLLLTNEKFEECLAQLKSHFRVFEEGRDNFVECYILALILRATFAYLSFDLESCEGDLKLVVNYCNGVGEGDFWKLCHVHVLILGALGAYNIGGQETVSGDYMKAAIEVDSKNPDIYYNRGFLKVMSQDSSAAMDPSVGADFNHAVLLSPDNAVAAAYEIYASFIIAVGAQREADVREAFQRFKALVGQFPANFFVHFLYGQLLTEDMHIPDAIAEFEAARRLDPQSPLPLIHIALARLRSVNDIGLVRHDVLPLLLQALSLDPRCELAHQLIANVYTQLCDLDKSIEHYTLASKLAHNLGDLKQTISLREAAICQRDACLTYGISMDEMLRIRTSVSRRLEQMMN